MPRGQCFQCLSDSFFVLVPDPPLPTFFDETLPIVSQDIFRKYPNRYESIISALCENLDTLDEPEAKVSSMGVKLDTVGCRSRVVPESCRHDP